MGTSDNYKRDYMLQKKVLQLRRQVQLERYSQEIKPFHEKLEAMKNTQGQIAGSLNEICETLDKFNKNIPEIEKKLRNTSCFNVPEYSASCLKNIKEQAQKILIEPIQCTDENMIEVVDTEKVENEDSNFLKNASDQLQKRKEFCANLSCLNSNIKHILCPKKSNSVSCDMSPERDFETEGVTISDRFLDLDDTMNTITSENVIASSPIH